MELMNDSRKGNGKRIFTEGRVVEARTLRRVCRLQCGLTGSASSMIPGGNTTLDEGRALPETCRVFSPDLRECRQQ
jgi:hypothetical protein